MLLADLLIGGALEFFLASLVDKVGDFIFRQLATELLFLSLNGPVAFLGPFGEPVDEGGRHTLDLEGRAGGAKGVAKLVEMTGQFVAIDGGRVMDGVEHGGGLQRFPALLGLVPRAA